MISIKQMAALLGVLTLSGLTTVLASSHEYAQTDTITGNVLPLETFHEYVFSASAGNVINATLTWTAGTELRLGIIPPGTGCPIPGGTVNCYVTAVNRIVTCNFAGTYETSSSGSIDLSVQTSVTGNHKVEVFFPNGLPTQSAEYTVTISINDTAPGTVTVFKGSSLRVARHCP